MADIELLTPHGIALLHLAQNPKTRAQDIAGHLSLTERAVQRLIGDLVEAGLVVRIGDGPTSAYQVPDGVREGVLPISGLARPDPPPNGTSSKRDEIRTRLLAAVERIIEAGESYAEISVERLVSEAGISRSTFYAHFQDKADLLQALMAQVLEEVSAAGEAWLSSPADAGRDEIQAALYGVVATYRTHGALMCAAADAASRAGSVREQYENFMERTAARIADYIRAGQRAGNIRPDLDPDRAATLLACGIERGLYKMVGDATAEDRVEQATPTLAGLVWNFLYAGYR